MHRIIKIRFQNGINGDVARNEIFNELADEFIFEESEQPDFILFGPYGIDIPKPGNYIRIGYYCENIIPDLSLCEWAFGVMPEAAINNKKYKRIQWHRQDPQLLVKPDDYNPIQILDKKQHFCNFLYSHPVPYREEFFRQLSKYKKVDAPGKSMNNMNSIDTLFKGDIWNRKKQFLGSYKFTIAFENYVYPGYQTEKLYDAMQVDSVPIYCGDPLIEQIFNTQSFVNFTDYVQPNNSPVIRWLEENSQLDFVDILPTYYHNPLQRLKRKAKSIGKLTKMKYQFRTSDFKQVIDRIVELDQDDNKFIEMLKLPWFKNNEPPVNASLKSRWMEIFNQPK